MKNIIKQFALFLLLCMPTTLLAFEVDGIYYKTNSDSTVYVAGGTNKYSGDIIIPANVCYNGKTYSVTSINSHAFYDCKNLKSVVIGNSITSIGSSAFYGCSGLTSIEIPKSVTSIGIEAFTGCSGLISIEIPNSVTYIRERTFKDCSGLTSIEIPNSVKSIGDNAFKRCTNLANFIIKDRATELTLGSNASYPLIED